MLSIVERCHRIPLVVWFILRTCMWKDVAECNRLDMSRQLSTANSAAGRIWWIIIVAMRGSLVFHASASFSQLKGRSPLSRPLRVTFLPTSSLVAADFLL